MSLGRGGWPPVENHGCRSPASQILSELLSSHPDSVLATTQGHRICVSNTNTDVPQTPGVPQTLGHLQCMATENLCCLKPHCHLPVCVLRLPVTHGPVAEIFIACFHALCHQPVSQIHGHRALHRDKETDTQTHYTRQGGAERLTRMKTKRGLTPTRPQLVMLNGSLGTLDLGVGRLDSGNKELRPNVTANHPHEASV